MLESVYRDVLELETSFYGLYLTFCISQLGQDRDHVYYIYISQSEKITN